MVIIYYFTYSFKKKNISIWVFQEIQAHLFIFHTLPSHKLLDFLLEFGNTEETEPLPSSTLNMGQEEQGQRDFQGKEQMVLGLEVKNQNPETQTLLTLLQKSSSWVLWF